jgi:hypothetical protein
MEEKKIGVVSNYFSNISVAAVEITDGTVSVGPFFGAHNRF